MAARRPLVRVGGHTQQLPTGDSVFGVPVYLPAYQQSAAMLKIVINSAYTLAVAQQGGTVLSVTVALNG